MSEEFNAQEYRANLVKTIKEKKSKAAAEIEIANAAGDVDMAERIKWANKDQNRIDLNLARWSEEYHKARLLKIGNYTINESGEIVDKKTGLTARQLADHEKLIDYFDSNISDLLKIIDERKISLSYLKLESTKRKAKNLFWMERQYGNGIDVRNAKDINRFIEIFELQDELKNAVEENLEIAVRESDRRFAENLLAAYPVFDISEIEKRISDKYYPIPGGLSGVVKAKELWGEIVEPVDGKPNVSLDKVFEVINNQAELLAGDIRNHPYLYWQLKRCMIESGGRPMGYGYDRWKLIRDEKFARAQGLNERNYVRAIFYLAEDPGKNVTYDERLKYTSGPRLEFHFSTSEDEIRIEDRRYHYYFSSPKIFRFEGAYVGNEKLGKNGPGLEKGILVKVGDADETQSLSTLEATKIALAEFAQDLLIEDKDVSESVNALKALAEKHAIPTDALTKIITSIKEFRKYNYRKKTSSVGDCLSTPDDFNGFCESKFGIKPDTARYGQYHPEWGSDMGYAPFSGTYHQVSVLFGKIVIDWTVTQFGSTHGDKPIPYIYEIGQERSRFGPLYKTYARTEPGNNNELYIDDPSDPIYIKEQPVTYGI